MICPKCNSILNLSEVYFCFNCAINIQSQIVKSVIPSWDQYFLNIAEVVKTRSKDPNTQVGSVIVDQDNHIIATGYNGFASKFPETKELWNSKDKHKYVVHAEINAIVNTVQKLNNAKLFTTLFPCSECAKIISASGIKTIVSYKDNKHPNKNYNFDVSEEIFKLNNIGIIFL